VVVTPYGRTVTALAIESYLHMVTSFTLRTSEDGVEWYDYIVHGKTEVRCFCKLKLKTHISLLKVKLLISLRGFYNIHEIKDVDINVLFLGAVCVSHFETAMFVTHALPTHASYI